MRWITLLIAFGALSACQWFAPGLTSSDPEKKTIPARVELEEPAFAQPGKTGGLCGGIAAITCDAETDYCRMYPGDCKNIADASGICTAKATMCTMQYVPVCGCDGKTYGNACTASTQGVSIAHNGPCRTGR